MAGEDPGGRNQRREQAAVPENTYLMDSGSTAGNRPGVSALNRSSSVALCLCVEAGSYLIARFPIAQSPLVVRMKICPSEIAGELSV